jgi:flagellar hook-basal body complex protein FliE
MISASEESFGSAAPRAVSNAELTLNTVVAVRDRVINAYQAS